MQPAVAFLYVKRRSEEFLDAAGRRIGPGSLMGIHLRRSSSMLSAVLTVLKTGAAYAPLAAEMAHLAGSLSGDLDRGNL